MIRVVLDTNMIVSAMLRSGGLPEAVFNLAMGGEVQCYISEPIVAEYEDVLRLPEIEPRMRNELAIGLYSQGIHEEVA